MTEERIKQLEEELARAKIRETELLHRCDLLEAELAALEARHNTLREVVAWERECRVTRNTMRIWHVWPAQDEAQSSYLAARAEVDRLLLGES